jgi:hypothetical protein
MPCRQNWAKRVLLISVVYAVRQLQVISKTSCWDMWAFLCALQVNHDRRRILESRHHRHHARESRCRRRPLLVVCLFHPLLCLDNMYHELCVWSLCLHSIPDIFTEIINLSMGCQIGTRCPILHAETDQVYPIGFRDASLELGNAKQASHLNCHSSQTCTLPQKDMDCTSKDGNLIFVGCAPSDAATSVNYLRYNFLG